EKMTHNSIGSFVGWLFACRESKQGVAGGYWHIGHRLYALEHWLKVRYEHSECCRGVIPHDSFIYLEASFAGKANCHCRQRIVVTRSATCLFDEGRTQAL